MNKMDNKKFKVVGMSCAACVARVEKSVSSLDGVESCEVNLLLGTMNVSGAASEERIIEAVQAAGYSASSERTDVKEKQEHDDATAVRRIFINRLLPSLILLAMLMYISMAHIMCGAPLFGFLAKNPISIGIAELILSALIMVINKDFFTNGLRGVVHLAPNMDTLVSLGSFASFAYSTCMLFVASEDMLLGNTEAAFHKIHGLYFESAAMILVLITVGKLLEALAKGKTTSAIRALMDLTPKMATVIKDGKEVLVSADEILLNDIFIVKRGENIPADGEVIEGIVSVDESALTGESIPQDKGVGKTVYGATSVLSGYAKIRAVGVGQETAMAKIIAMVKEASGSKAPVAKAADRVAGVFVPIVLGISLATFAVWMIFSGGISSALTHAVSVLVISCPCALGLATPTAVMVGSGVGAKRGILFKTAASLEASGKIKAVAFDKTGTLTEGKMTVSDVIEKSVSERELISAAASLEAKSEHPLALAVVNYAKESTVEYEPLDNFTAEEGGVFAEFGEEFLYGGNLSYISRKTDLPCETVKADVNRLSEEGKTPIIFATVSKILGIIAITDSIREDSAEAVSKLSKMGIETVMITGDNRKCAEYVASRVGISEVIAEVMPNEKANEIKRLSQKYGMVAMVGDGINDAVALTSADVGISVSGGTDVAADSADIILTSRRLSDVASSVRLGKRTLLNIYENLFWAFIYNIIGIPLAAGAFSPLFGWNLDPMFGAAAMSISSFIVVMNALRLNLYDPTRSSETKFMKRNVCKKEDFMKKVVIKIEGMMCPHCSGRVKNALEAHDAVEAADVSHERADAIITLRSDIEISELEALITDAGYKVIK